MPTDLSIPNSIIQAFQAGAKLKESREARIVQEQQNRDKIIQDQQRIAEEERRNAALEKQFYDRLKQEDELAKAGFKFQESEHKLRVAKTKADIANMLGGIATPEEPEENVSIFNLPEVGEIRALSPKGQIEKKRALGKVEAEIEGQKAKSVAEAEAPTRLEELQVREGLHAQTLEKMQAMQNANSKDLLKLRMDLAKDNAAFTIGLRARYKRLEGGQGVLDPEALNVVLGDLENGVTTLEDLQKQGFKPTERSLINTTLSSKGYRPLKNNEQKDLQNLTKVKSLYTMVSQMNDAINAGDMQTANVLKETYISVRGELAKSIGGQGGAISQADVMAMDAYLPDVYVSFPNLKSGKNPLNVKSSNALRLKQMEGRVRAKQDSILNRFKLPQQHNFIQTYNLLEDEDLGPGKKVGQ